MHSRPHASSVGISQVASLLDYRKYDITQGDLCPFAIDYSFHNALRISHAATALDLHSPPY